MPKKAYPKTRLPQVIDDSIRKDSNNKESCR